MPFISDIVEIRELLRQMRLILPLFEDILLFIPAPRLIYLPEILYNQRACFNAFLPLAEYSNTFGVYSEVPFVLFLAHLYSREHNLRHLPVELSKARMMFFIDNELQSLSDIVPKLSLLLNGKHYLIFYEVALQFHWNVPWKKE